MSFSKSSYTHTENWQDYMNAFHQMDAAFFLSSAISLLFELWPFYNKGISECIQCAPRLASGFISVYGTARCDKLRVMRASFYLETPKPDTGESSQSHFTQQQAKRPLPLPPPSSSSSLSYFHPLLMCDTLILNIPFPMVWPIGFTCRWVGNLHRLKGLPSILMLSDNGASIHPLC